MGLICVITNVTICCSCLACVTHAKPAVRCYNLQCTSKVYIPWCVGIVVLVWIPTTAVQKRHRLSHSELVGSFKEGGGVHNTRSQRNFGSKSTPHLTAVKFGTAYPWAVLQWQCGGSKALPRMCDVAIPGTDLAYNCFSRNRCVVWATGQLFWSAVLYVLNVVLN